MNEDQRTKTDSPDDAGSRGLVTRHGRSDTDPEVDRILLERLRDLPSQRKAEMIQGLCRSVQALALAGLRSRYPSADDPELRLRLAALRLDREIMIRLFDWDPLERGY